MVILSKEPAGLPGIIKIMPLSGVGVAAVCGVMPSHRCAGVVGDGIQVVHWAHSS